MAVQLALRRSNRENYCVISWLQSNGGVTDDGPRRAAGRSSDVEPPTPRRWEAHRLGVWRWWILTSQARPAEADRPAVILLQTLCLRVHSCFKPKKEESKREGGGGGKGEGTTDDDGRQQTTMTTREDSA